jgi:hypothetical protein
MHQDNIRQHQILYKTGSTLQYLVVSCPKGGPISLYSDSGQNFAVEPYQLGDYGIDSEPLCADDVRLGQVLTDFGERRYEVTSVYRGRDLHSVLVSAEIKLVGGDGTTRTESQHSIGKYRLHTQSKEEPMRFGVPTTTTAATSFSTVDPANAVKLDAPEPAPTPEPIVELGGDEDLRPSRLLLTLPAEVVRALARAELGRETTFTGDCTLDQIATDRLERILPRLLGLLTENEVPKRDW